MKDRLESILKHYKLSSSKLAEMIDVQRSGISHILSGRNNPSYDFLLRILNTFPDINANWLLTGKGNMVDDAESIPVFKDEDEPVYKSVSPIIPEEARVKSAERTDLPNTALQDSYKSKQGESPSKSIDKVIILFSDGKFKEYSQE